MSRIYSDAEAVEGKTEPSVGRYLQVLQGEDLQRGLQPEYEEGRNVLDVLIYMRRRHLL